MLALAQRGLESRRLSSGTSLRGSASAELQPDKSLSYVGLGLSYAQRSDLPEAVRVLRDRVRTDPHDALIRYFLGDALLRSGEDAGNPTIEEAKISLEESVKLDPNRAPAQVDLAKIYLMENRVSDAVAHLEKARTLDPKNKSVYSHLAIAYRRLGKTDAMKEAVEQLRKINDEEHSAHAAEFVHLVKTAGPEQSRKR